MMEYVLAGIGVAIANRYILKHKSQIKGLFGERKLARAVKRLALPGKVEVLRDALFHTAWNETNQIDVLAVTRYGVLVLENKNFNCDIYGAVGDRTWVCKYPRGGIRKSPFDYAPAKREYNREETKYSPILQNNTHASVVTSLLQKQYPDVPIYPLVVYSDDTNLHIKNSQNKVCNLRQLGKVVARITGKPVLTDRQVKEISALLEREQIKGRRARKKHIARVSQIEEEAKEASYNKELQEKLFHMAKDEPILNANGQVYPRGRDDASVFSPNTPLSQMIQTAKSREQKHVQSQSEQGRSNNQYTR